MTFFITRPPSKRHHSHGLCTRASFHPEGPLEQLNQHPRSVTQFLPSRKRLVQRRSEGGTRGLGAGMATPSLRLGGLDEVPSGSGRPHVWAQSPGEQTLVSYSCSLSRPLSSKIKKQSHIFGCGSLRSCPRPVCKGMWSKTPHV